MISIRLRTTFYFRRPTVQSRCAVDPLRASKTMPFRLHAHSPDWWSLRALPLSTDVVSATIFFLLSGALCRVSSHTGLPFTPRRASGHRHHANSVEWMQRAKSLNGNSYARIHRRLAPHPPSRLRRVLFTFSCATYAYIYRIFPIVLPQISSLVADEDFDELLMVPSRAQPETTHA
ncbi:hypothetical protein SCHPADRAFT_648783 [Schizopora paradoxa]|uniref:Uncharacterized protein n=1 Tax=Schizopora paradoxa TaxID=27342 RepID=A0A0H2R6H6_9AGAM|nr:hypothetical protein SCHPADRAFT_648783 [Schizopora paradoxa]